MFVVEEFKDWQWTGSRQTLASMWVLVHTSRGPFAVCPWYRPPVPGEIASIMSWCVEFDTVRTHVIGCVLVGNVNVHQASWLRLSTHNSLEGVQLRSVMSEQGCRQLVEYRLAGPTSWICA